MKFNRFGTQHTLIGIRGFPNRIKFLVRLLVRSSAKLLLLDLFVAEPYAKPSTVRRSPSRNPVSKSPAHRDEESPCVSLSLAVTVVTLWEYRRRFVLVHRFLTLVFENFYI